MMRLLRALSAVALAAAMSLTAAGPALAQTQTEPVACTGTQVAHYGPPLGPIPQDTTVQIIETLGEQGDGSCPVGPFTSGRATAVFHQQASCLIPPPFGTLPEPNVVTYRWHQGGFSTITYTVTVVVRGVGQTIVTSTGTVTDGFNQGAVAQRVKALPDLNLLECLQSQVTQRTGPISLTIG